MPRSTRPATCRAGPCADAARRSGALPTASASSGGRMLIRCRTRSTCWNERRPSNPPPERHHPNASTEGTTDVYEREELIQEDNVMSGLGPRLRAAVLILLALV